MKKSTKYLALASAATVALAVGAAVASTTVFNLYAALTGTEIINDMANPTGGQFTTATLATYVRGSTPGVNAQTGTSYTVLSTDAGKLITFSNTSPVAVTLPRATTAGFTSGQTFLFENKNSGAVTITPTTSTINGAATLVLKQDRGVIVRSDGTNYSVEVGGAGLLTTPATVAEGGTGAASLTAHGVLLGEGTSAVTPLTAATTGQLLQGASGADPVFATALTGSYTFSGALNTFTGARQNFGSTTPTHLSTSQTTPPALTCGGGSPTIAGSDTAGVVTAGTSTTSCVITFNAAYTGTPFCTVSSQSQLTSFAYAVSNTAITVTQTSTSGNLINYNCFGPTGG